MSNMKTKRPVIILMAAMLAVSCGRRDDPTADMGQPSNDADAISFSALVAKDEADTRADAEVSLAELKDGGSTGFGVFASYTGIYRYGDTSVTSDFMHNQQVQWAGTAWNYSPVKYWPGDEGEYGENTQYISFFAYAPYSDAVGSDPATNPVGYCISGFSESRDKGDPWLTYRLIDQANIGRQVDLLYAKRLDMTRPAVEVPVAFTFEHALACVGDEVTIDVGNDLKTELRAFVTGGTSRVELVLTDVDITYTLAEKGRLVLWNRDGKANWKPVMSENLVTERTPAITASLPMTIYSYNGSAESSPAWTDSGHGVFYIPINPSIIAQKATVSVSYRVVLNGSVVFSTHEASTDIALDSYAEAGGKVALKVSLIKLN